MVPSGRVLLVGILAFAVVFGLGAWVFITQGAVGLWLYATAVVAIVAWGGFAPYARSYGRPGEGAVAVWLAIILGPVSLLILIPWLAVLPSRFEAEEDWSRSPWPLAVAVGVTAVIAVRLAVETVGASACAELLATTLILCSPVEWWLLALVGAALVVLTYLALRRWINRPDAG